LGAKRERTYDMVVRNLVLEAERENPVGVGGVSLGSDRRRLGLKGWRRRMFNIYYLSSNPFFCIFVNLFVLFFFFQGVDKQLELPLIAPKSQFAVKYKLAYEVVKC